MTTVNLNFEVEGASLNALRTQLKEVRSAMAEATDPAYMAQLAAAAGEVKDKMMDVNESIREMSAGSDFEKVNNSIGGMKEGLANMDFGKVADSASNLATNVGKISFKSAIGGIKDMGKAFLSVGKALLTNPIFLLATVLIAVVAGVMLLLNALGLLKPILAAIKAAIGFIVDLFHALTDAMGLTENAAAEQAAAQTKASEERIKDLEAEKAAMTANYEATKGMSADELAIFEQVTGEKAAGYDDMMNLESDLAAEKMRLTAAASESARIEFGKESQEYADAKDAETKAANDHAAVEQKILLNRVNAANSAEKTLQSLRAGAIENEGARAKAFLQIQQGEAIAKLEAAKKVAEADLKLAKSPEQKAIVQQTLNDLNESILLTKESFAKQSTEIDKKAADSARAAQAKAAGDAQRAAADRAKAYEELVKKGLEKIRGENSNHIKELSADQQAGTADYLSVVQKGLTEELAYVLANHKTLKLSDTDLNAFKLDNAAAMAAAQAVFDKADLERANKIAIDKAQAAVTEAKTFEDLQAARIALLQKEGDILLQNTELSAQDRVAIAADTAAKIAAIEAISTKDFADAQKMRDTAAIKSDERAIEAKQKELADFKGGTDAKLALIQQIYDLEEALRAKKLAADVAALDAEKAVLEQRIKNGEILTATEIERIRQIEAEKVVLNETAVQAGTEAAAIKVETDAQVAEEKLAKDYANVQAGLDIAAQGLAVLAELQATRQANETEALDKKHARELKGLKEGSAEYEAATKRQKDESEALARAQFKSNKKMQMGAAVINAATAITASLAQAPVAIGPLPNPAGIASLAFAAINSAMAIAKIASSQYESGGGSAADASTPSIPEVGAEGGATPAINLFGQGNNANTETFGAGGSGSQTINVVATVSESDITSTQQRVAQMNKNAEL